MNSACISAIIAAVSVALSSRAQAQPWSFVRVVQTGDPMPGSPGKTFGGGGEAFPAAAISGGRVAFIGQGTLGFQGVYEWNAGTRSLVANTQTIIPGGSSAFTGFAAPSINGANIAFLGGTSTGSAVFARLGGALGLVADQSTSRPNGGAFSTFVSPTSIYGSDVVFGARSSTPPNGRGVYRASGGTVTAIADETTIISAGTGAFTNFRDWSVYGTEVTFTGVGSGGQTGIGIYRGSGGPVTRVYDTSSSLPGGGGTFTGFGELDIDESDLCFLGGAADLNRSGVYKAVGGILSLVVDKNTSAPGGGTFSFVDSPFIGNGSVAFRGAVGPLDDGGIYSEFQGSIAPIVRVGETFDGRVVQSVGLFGRVGDTLLIQIEFSAVSQLPPTALYLITVPAPAATLPLAIAGALIASRRRRVQ